MMAMAFFISNLGDTNLAIATVRALKENKLTDPIFFIPLTSTAKKHIQATTLPAVTYISLLDEITENAETLLKKQITEDEIKKVSSFIEKHNIQRVYIGMPAQKDEKIPFQLAHSLKNCAITIANEHMSPLEEDHTFWDYLDVLSAKDNCDFVVPLENSKQDITEKNSRSYVNVIGHLSIDAAFTEEKIDPKILQDTRKTLAIGETDKFIFISSSTKPIQKDQSFLTTLLTEFNTGKYPNLQLRFGLHPGITPMDVYLNAILKTCADLKPDSKKFKIILTPEIKTMLEDQKIAESEFILDLETDISGAIAAKSADGVGQVVTGALPSEKAVNGGSVYTKQKTYLPEDWFSPTAAAFFKAVEEKPQQPRHCKTELGLSEKPVGQVLAAHMRRPIPRL